MNGLPIVQGYLSPVGRAQLTGLSSVKGFASVPAGTTIALIQAESQNIRWRDDGTNPSATVGMILVANDTLIYSGTMSAIKFIETTASAKINITFYQVI